MSAASDALNRLNAQWYNAVTAGCGLDPSAFQLFQGAAPLGNTSQVLWSTFDAVPPLSVANLYNPSQSNNFSSDYGAMIFSLMAQGTAKLEKDLGDYYVPFMDAWKASTDTSLTQLQFWEIWSSKNCPDKYAIGASDILAMKNNPVTVAQSQWIASGGAGTAKAYNKTIEMLKSILPSGPTKTVAMSSATTSSDVSRSWAKASASGGYSIFSGGANAQYDSISTSFAGSSVVATATYSNLVTLAAAPLSQKSTDPILKGYEPWYNSAVMGMAFATRDNTLWTPGVTPSWNTTFGPSGNMQRMCTTIVVVDGITMSITSSASFSASQFQQFQAAAQGGVWPFFQASGSGGWTNSTSRSDQGTITVTSSSPKGNPVILGVLVSPASAQWG